LINFSLQDIRDTSLLDELDIYPSPSKYPRKKFQVILKLGSKSNVLFLQNPHEIKS